MIWKDKNVRLLRQLWVSVSEKVSSNRAKTFPKSKVNRERLFVVLGIEPKVSHILSIWQTDACAQVHLQPRKKF